MERGYIKLWRCIQHNSLWNDEKFSRGQAWLDLILLANHKPVSIRKRGIKIDVGRGQVGWSERQLADRWQWSRGKVSRFLKELEDSEQIEQQNGPQNINVTSLITITNYEKYQSNEPQNEPQMIPQTGRKRAANSTMNKNEKNEKNEKKGMFEICIAWKAFIEMRNKIKKPMTPYAMKLRINELDRLTKQGQDPVAVLNQSTGASWQDLYAVKLENKEIIEPAKKTEYVDAEMSEKLKAMREKYEL